jgi:lipopolysaccharide export system permease protein
MRPYIIGATIISVFALIMSVFLVPSASAGFKSFRYKYLIGNGQNEVRDNSDVFRQISKDEYIFVSNFQEVNQTAYNFSMEKFEGDQLKYKLIANRIKWNPKEKNYTLFNFTKRKVGAMGDIIETAERKDTVFNFDLEDLTPVVYIAETLPLNELHKFIDKEKARGSSNINTYLVVLYKKYSIPVSAFILTIIAVAVSAMKRRGGMGANLAIGIVLAFAFVFLDKVFGVLAEKSTAPPLLAVWTPNIVFGILALYLLRNAKR